MVFFFEEAEFFFSAAEAHSSPRVRRRFSLSIKKKIKSRALLLSLFSLATMKRSSNGMAVRDLPLSTKWRERLKKDDPQRSLVACCSWRERSNCEPQAFERANPFLLLLLLRGDPTFSRSQLTR